MAKSDSSALAGVMYILNIVGIIGIIVDVILWAVKRDDKFINYHFKQLLVLWIAGVIVSIVGWLTMIIVIGFVILIVGGIILLVLWIIGMVNAFKGLEKPIPIIGKYGEKFGF